MDWQDFFTNLFAPIALIVFTYFLNRQVQLGVSSKRLEGYASLWELMREVAPTDLEFERLNPLSQSQRDDLYTKLTDWYFKRGSGIFLSRHSRNIYLAVKKNLVCDPSHFVPKEQGDKVSDDRLRTKLLVRQFSLLRDQMRRDLAVYADPFYRNLEQSDEDKQSDEDRQSDEDFLEEIGESADFSRMSRALTNLGGMIRPRRRMQTDRPTPAQLALDG